MLEEVSLRNFKAAKELPIPLRALTILTGLNGSGKSTVLQSLAALKQSAASLRSDGFRLRGPLVQLGTYSDIYTEGAETEGVSICVREAGQAFAWDMLGEANSAVLKVVKQSSDWPSFMKKERFQLLPADRIVPQNLFERAQDADADVGFLGPRGEYVVEFLLSETARKLDVSVRRSFPAEGLDLSASLLEKVAPTGSLVDQVSGWLQQLSPGVRVNVDELLHADEVLLRFGYVGRTGVNESSRLIRPANVGFGLTYSLPIVVACLAAPAGTLLLLENPEAHLHPQGQAALGLLVAQAASDGVQILLETHSDHVLNGIRVAVKTGCLLGRDVSINYFRRDVGTGFVTVDRPSISDKGRLSHWPRGFFDQLERDLSRL